MYWHLCSTTFPRQLCLLSSYQLCYKWWIIKSLSLHFRSPNPASPLCIDTIVPLHSQGSPLCCHHISCTTDGGLLNPSHYISGALILLALYVLTPLFHYIPKAALSAVIISAVLQMVDYNPSHYISGALILLALYVLTPLFHYIPKAALSAVIISAVLQMVDYKIVLTLWRVNS